MEYLEMDLARLDLFSLPDLENELLAHLFQQAPHLAFLGMAGSQVELSLLRTAWLPLDKVSNLALIAPGSAGRFEGAGVGDLDLMLLWREDSGPEAASRERAENVAGEISAAGVKNPFMNAQSCQCSLLAVDEVKSLVLYGRAKAPFPDRLTGAVLIAGSPILFADARERAAAEMLEGKGLLKKLKDDVKVHRKTATTGVLRFKGVDYVQVDLKEHEAIYNPEVNQSGLKYGPLRCIQRGLEFEFHSYLSRNGCDASEVLSFNPGTEERFRFFARKGWVKDEDLFLSLAVLYQQSLIYQAQLKIECHFRGEVPAITRLNDSFLPVAEETLRDWSLGELLN